MCLENLVAESVAIFDSVYCLGARSALLDLNLSWLQSSERLMWNLRDAHDPQATSRDFHEVGAVPVTFDNGYY